MIRRPSQIKRIKAIHDQTRPSATKFYKESPSDNNREERWQCLIKFDGEWSGMGMLDRTRPSVSTSNLDWSSFTNCVKLWPCMKKL